MKTTRLTGGLFVMATMLFLCPRSAAQETVTIDAAKKIGPAVQRASGILGGFDGGETALDDAILLSIKPRLLRTFYQHVPAIYNRCQAMNCAIEVSLYAGPEYKAKGYSVEQDGYPGDNGNWEPWLKYVSEVAGELNRQNMTNLSFCIWDNADRRQSWPRTDEQYFETWKRTYTTLKQLMPAAKLVGPSTTWGPNTIWWKDHKGDDTWYLRNFLSYCISNQCLPDIVSRHDHYPDGSGIERDAAALNAFFKQQNIKPIPFEEDDLGPRIPDNLFAPGIYISLFASVERVQVARTAKCWWDKDGYDNLLNGLITKDTRQPRSLWWTYKAYADITGDIVWVTRSDSADAVAGVESGGKVLRILIGRYGSSSRPVSVKVIHFAGSPVPVQATAYKIKNLRQGKMDQPEATVNLAVDNSDGVLGFTLKDMDDYSAYFVELRVSE